MIFSQYQDKFILTSEDLSPYLLKDSTVEFSIDFDFPIALNCLILIRCNSIWNIIENAPYEFNLMLKDYITIPDYYKKIMMVQLR